MTGRRSMARALFVATLTLLGASALPASAQPKVRALSEQELVDMMQGSSIQATRGSDTAAMVRRVRELLAQGHTFTMIAVEDVPDDWTIASGGGIGGGGAWEYVRERTAREQGRDPIAALVEAAKGYKLFQGIVTASEDRGEGGFSFSDVEIRGTGEFSGHTYTVYVKNENIVGWLDGEPDAMSPDCIANLDPATGDTLNPPTLGAYVVDQEVVLVGWPNAPRQWRTPRGIEAFGPRHFGFDFDYVPIEELQQARKLGR